MQVLIPVPRAFFSLIDLLMSRALSKQEQKERGGQKYDKIDHRSECEIARFKLGALDDKQIYVQREGGEQHPADDKSEDSLSRKRRYQRDYAEADKPQYKIEDESEFKKPSVCLHSIDLLPCNMSVTNSL